MSTKTHRLVARVTAEQKEFFEYAAALHGRSLSDFMVESMNAAAKHAVKDHEIMLGALDRAAIVKALLNPEPPNERLRAAFRHYREIMKPDGD
jgi:uncharacterized protein (DUF1778 family)